MGGRAVTNVTRATDLDEAKEDANGREGKEEEGVGEPRGPVDELPRERVSDEREAVVDGEEGVVRDEEADRVGAEQRHLRHAIPASGWPAPAARLAPSR